MAPRLRPRSATAVGAQPPRARRSASPVADRTAHGGRSARGVMTETETNRIVLVDGSNVAHSAEGGKAKIESIVLICEKLVEEGFQPIVVVDAALRHQIDDEDRYEQLVSRGEIKQAPAGTDADFFILSFARELEASIVSNDRFKDHQKAFPEARERVIRYMIVEGEVVFERRAKRR
jgi:hypothetical protein